MILTLKREIFNENNTISSLYINDVFFCHVLEDIDRGLAFTDPIEKLKAQKVYGKTAIPKGVYEVVITYSEKFKAYLPLLLNVPAYNGIRIHSGTTEEHTLGCLLPGIYSNGKLINSRLTFKKLFAVLKKAERQEKIIIFIESPK